MPQFAYAFVLNVIPLVIAVVLHEISHSAVAYVLGDDTAKNAGRFKLHTHFDLYGSFLIPLGLYLIHSPFLIGYAKPVPIDPRKFQHPLQDMALVAIAGPLCNLLLASSAAIVLKDYSPSMSGIMIQISMNFIVINLALFFFNLIPIPPLDGSRILAAIIPLRWVPKFYAFEAWGFFIIIGIEALCRQISNMTGTNIGIFDSLIKTPLLATLNFLLS